MNNLMKRVREDAKCERENELSKISKKGAN
jgi:hypothetical protein